MAKYEWRFGKEYEYVACPFNASRQISNGNEEAVTVTEEAVTFTTEVGYYGGYSSCNHSVEVSVPMNVFIAVMEANGFTVTKK